MTQVMKDINIVLSSENHSTWEKKNLVDFHSTIKQTREGKVFSSFFFFFFFFQ